MIMIVRVLNVSLKGTNMQHNIMVIWVKIVQTEFRVEIYSKGPVRAMVKYYS